MKNESSKNNKVLLWAVFIILAVVAIFLFVTLALPAITAHKQLGAKLEGFESMSENDIMQVFDPMYRDGGFYGDVTAELDKEQTQALAKKLISVCDKAKYSSTQKTIVGNWDISVVLRKTEGGICSVYFAEDKFYVAVDDTQYYFSPVSDRADEYKEFYGELERLIIEKKAAMA